jgi:hypothetical protein
VPRQNRVTPYGTLIATEERGLLLGNRGVLHDAQGRIRRLYQVRRWIACRLEFRGRRRELMRPGRWTELFFLDEATAMAAGHRPCGECRHADHLRFRAAFVAAHPGHAGDADSIDHTLHLARLGDDRRTKRTFAAAAAGLPDGVMVELEGRPWLVLGDDLLAWSPAGYGERSPRSGRATLTVITPAPIVAAIAAGYAPAIHPTARGA